MKKLKCIVALLVVIGVFLSDGSLVSFACLYPPSEDGKDATQLEEDNDIRYWHQGQIPYTPGELIIPGSSASSTIGEAACSHFAMTYALVKMGVFDTTRGDGPMTQIQNARDYNAWGADWGYFAYNRVSELYQGVVCENNQDFTVAGKPLDQCITYIKGLLAEGKYVIAIVQCAGTSGHCIFIDGVNEDGVLSIGDSAFNGLDWNGYYANAGTTFKYLVILSYTTPSNERPSIYDGNALRRDKNADAKDIEAKNMIVSEWELEGMPPESSLDEFLKTPFLCGTDGLEAVELSSLRAIKEARDSNKLSLISIVGTTMSLLGILIITYALLLLLSCLIDMYNPLDISLVGVLTIGNIHIVDKDDDISMVLHKAKRGYMTRGKFFVTLVVLALIGCLMIAGKIYVWAYLLAGVVM